MLIIAGVMTVVAGFRGIIGDDSGATVSALVAIYVVLLEIALQVRKRKDG